MSGHEKEKQALEEMDRARDENLASANAPVNQQILAQPKPTPYEEFKQLTTELQSTIRQQQLKAEQSIQQTLQQAAGILGDAQKIDLMTIQVQAIQQALSQQGPTNNPQFFSEILQQLGTAVREQLHQSDQQVAQALQQTVSSMAQSQSAMFDSQSFTKMADMLKQCERTLQNWQNPAQKTVH